MSTWSGKHQRGWRSRAAYAALAWIAVLAFTLGSCAAAAELELEKAQGEYPLSPVVLYLEDPSQSLKLEDVIGSAAARFKPAQPRAGEINFGYSHSAYWLAVPLRPAPDAPSRWLLEIAYSSLDRVDVYYRQGAAYAHQTAGDLQPFVERPYPHRNLVFPLDLEPGKAQTVYIRARSEGNLTIPATLWQPEALHVHDQVVYTLLSVYYGMLLALLLYNLLLYLSIRDPVFLAYVFCVGSMAVAMTSQNGFGNQFLWPHFPQWGNAALPAGMMVAGFFGSLFTRLFLSTREAFPRLDRVMLGFAVLFALSTLSPFVLPYQFSAILTSLGGLVFSAVAVVSGVYCHTKGHPGARYFLLAWTLLLAGVATLALRNMGILPTTPLTSYSMQIGSAVEMLLLSFALADRINVLRRKESELQHRAQHDPLTGLPNRLLFSDRVAQAFARARRTQGTMAVLVVDLDNFKVVNDTFGHAAGDKVLQSVAVNMRDGLREADTLARLGGDEFVVVLEDTADVQAAVGVAEKAIAAVKRSADGPGLSTLSASVGIACFPDHADDVDTLLKRADEAMYAAKSAGRNCWRVAGTEKLKQAG